MTYTEIQPWRPLVRVPLLPEEAPTYIEAGIIEVWANDRYLVFVRNAGPRPPFGEVIHLSITMHDSVIRRDWREWQKIKNQLCGEETTAIEVYPPESHLIDNGNAFHLWCFHYDLPFGWKHRSIIKGFGPQRAFANGEEPEDTKDATTATHWKIGPRP